MAVIDRDVGDTVYINGKVVILNTSTDTSSNDFNSTHDFYIGARSDDYAYYDGLIDEVRIYNYALTAEQIKTEYTGGAVRFGE